MATWSITPSVSNPDDQHTLRTPANGPFRLSQTASMASQFLRCVISTCLISLC